MGRRTINQEKLGKCNSRGIPSCCATCMAVLKVLTKYSVRLLEAEWYKGGTVNVRTPFAARYCLSSSATDCGPLSNTNESGSPCDAKTCHRTVMVLPAMVETILNTTGHL